MSQKRPLLSVIIPIYNTADYLEKCVRSVMDTEARDFEVILVDDGSTDDSRLIARRMAATWPDQIQLVVQENHGLGGARNTGIHAAAGEYLLLVDSDDYLAPRALDEIMGFCGQSFDILVFDALQVDVKGQPIAYLSGSRQMNPQNLNHCPELLLEHPAAWNKVIRRRLFFDHNIWFPSRVWYEDIRTIPKLYLHAQRILYQKRPLYNYVRREGSIMNSASCGRNLEIIEAMDDLFAYYQQYGGQQYRNQLVYAAFHHQLIAATVRVNQIDRGNPAVARLREDFFERCPDYKRNPYIRNLGWKERLLFFLIRHRLYRCLHWVGLAARRAGRQLPARMEQGG